MTLTILLDNISNRITQFCAILNRMKQEKCVYLAKSTKPEYNLEEKLDEPNWRDILSHCWWTISQCVKANKS